MWNVYGYRGVIVVLVRFGMERGFLGFGNKWEEDGEKVYGNWLLFVGGVWVVFVVVCMGFLDGV